MVIVADIQDSAAAKLEDANEGSFPGESDTDETKQDDKYGETGQERRDVFLDGCARQRN